MNSSGYVLDEGGKKLGKWENLVGQGHNSLTLGRPSNKDIVLYQERIRMDYQLIGVATHTFEYTCKEGERITAVLAYDEWGDNTGGTPKKKSGGVGHQEVTIEITAQLLRGFHFKFVVYGRRQK